MNVFFFSSFFTIKVLQISSKHLWKVGAQKQASLKVLKSGGLEPRSLIGVYAYEYNYTNRPTTTIPLTSDYEAAYLAE